MVKQIYHCKWQEEKLNYTSESGREILNLLSILFIKSRLHCRRFAPWCNLGILFHKFSVNLILNSLSLLLSDWSPVLYTLLKPKIHVNKKRFPDINHPHLWFPYYKMSAMDQEPLARISSKEKTAVLALEEDSTLAEWHLKMETFILANFRASFIHLETIELVEPNMAE